MWSRSSILRVRDQLGACTRLCGHAVQRGCGIKRRGNRALSATGLCNRRDCAACFYPPATRASWAPRHASGSLKRLTAVRPGSAISLASCQLHLVRLDRARDHDGECLASVIRRRCTMHRQVPQANKTNGIAHFGTASGRKLPRSRSASAPGWKLPSSVNENTAATTPIDKGEDVGDLYDSNLHRECGSWPRIAMPMLGGATGSAIGTAIRPACRPKKAGLTTRIAMPTRARPVTGTSSAQRYALPVAQPQCARQGPMRRPRDHSDRSAGPLDGRSRPASTWQIAALKAAARTTSRSTARGWPSINSPPSPLTPSGVEATRPGVVSSRGVLMAALRWRLRWPDCAPLRRHCGQPSFLQPTAGHESPAAG
jgi:hypothetical protein